MTNGDVIKGGKINYDDVSKVIRDHLVSNGLFFLPDDVERETLRSRLKSTLRQFNKCKINIKKRMDFLNAPFVFATSRDADESEEGTAEVGIAKRDLLNVNGQLERANRMITDLQAKVSLQRHELESLEDKLQNQLEMEKLVRRLETRVKVLKKSNRRKTRRLFRSSRQKIVRNSAKHGHCVRIIRDLKKRLAEVNTSVGGQSSVVTKERRRNVGGTQFTDEIFCLCLKLRSICKVSEKHVSACIRYVAADLFNVEISPKDLPSRAYLSNLLSKGHMLSKIHLAETLRRAGRNAILHTDGTTKKFTNYAGFQIAVGNETPLHMALSMVPNNSAKVLLNSFDSVIKDLVTWTFEGFFERQTDADGRQVVETIYAQIQAIMSDRSKVNAAFCELFNELRQRLFENKEAWQSANLPGRAINVYCGLHLIANMAMYAEKALLTFQEVCLGKGSKVRACSKFESRTLRLLQHTMQGLHLSGSPKFGKGGAFKRFLQARGKTCRFEALRGNRLYIIFSNASALMFHAEDIMAFLETIERNSLLDSIRDDLEDITAMAGCRALAIINAEVIRPLWRLVMCPSDKCSLTDMNDFYQSLVHWISDKSSNLNKLDEMKGGPFPEEWGLTDSKEVAFRNSLYVTDSLTESLTVAAVRVILGTCYGMLKRQLQDHLEGGVLTRLSDSELEALKFCQKTNNVSERIFALLDHCLRFSPHMTPGHREALIALALNGAIQWLQGLEKTLRHDLIYGLHRALPKYKLTQKRKAESLDNDQSAVKTKRQKTNPPGSAGRQDVLRGKVLKQQIDKLVQGGELLAKRQTKGVCRYDQGDKALPSLEGRRVAMKFQHEDGHCRWHEGEVVERCPVSSADANDPRKQPFVVEFSSDPGVHYTYCLYQDWFEEDLVLLEEGYEMETGSDS